MKSILASVAAILIAAGTSESKLLMDTHGIVSFAPYVNGVKKTDGLYPGYRAEFLAHADFYQHGRLVLTGLVGNMTAISRSDSSFFTLDRIRYTLSPGFRLEFTGWLIRGSVHHESIYTISRAEDREGAYWANSIRLGAGTKGSYSIYLRERYRGVSNRFLHALDANIDAGMILHGKRSIWSAKNHDYRWETLGQVRYHIGSFGKWVFFTGASDHMRIRENRETENTFVLSLHVLRKGLFSFFGVVYSYTPYDTFSENNENGLGSVSLRAVF